MRKQFTMTEKQQEKILEACKPVPYMVFGGRGPRSPQERANAAWESLGDELGFKYMTVKPLENNPRTFTAETKDTPK